MSNNLQMLHYTKDQIPEDYGRLNAVKAKLLCVNEVKLYLEPSEADVEAHVATITAWAKKINYPETHCAKYETLAVTGSTLSIYLAPTLGSNSEDLIAFGKLLTWLLTIDDIMDNLTYNHSEMEENTYKNISKDVELFAQILDGKRHVGEGVPAPVSTLIHYEVLAHVVQDVYDSLKESICCYKNEKGHFVQAIYNFLHGFLWRHQRPTGTEASLESYIFFRRHISASFAIFEIMALLHDIKWSEIQVNREDIEFEKWRNAFASCICITNDVLSLRKELTDKETENLIIQKHLVNGASIEKAVKETISFVNYEVNEVRIYTRRLLERFPEDAYLKRLVAVTSLAIDGHLHWYGYTNRYGALGREIRSVSQDEYETILGEKHE